MVFPGVGATLQNSRMALGLTLADISRQTRISPRFLDAIEADNLSRFYRVIYSPVILFGNMPWPWVSIQVRSSPNYQNKTTSFCLIFRQGPALRRNGP